MKILIDYIVQRIGAFKGELKEYNFMKTPLVYLMVINSIAIFSIIRADFKYIDDLGRVLSGGSGWGSTFSRHTSDFLSKYIHGDRYLTDISPLTQLIAVFFISLSEVFTIYILTGKHRIRLWDLIAVIPIGLSPYFLECISYKYDSPYMALSVLAGITPLLFMKYSYLLFIIAASLGSLLMFTTYQASSGIFPMLVILLGFRMWNQRKSVQEIVKFMVSSACGYICGCGIFALLIMKQVNTYVSSQLASFSQIIHNYKTYYNYVNTDFKKWWLVLIACIALCFIFTAVKDSKQKKWQAFFLSIATVWILSAVCFGLYLALSAPLFVPRAMYGFGVLIAFLAVLAVHKDKIYIPRLICTALSWVFLVFSCTYGNMLAEQKRYTDFRIQEVINDLSSIVNSDETISLKLSGGIGLSPVITNITQNFQILNRLVPATFDGNGWFWGKVYFYGYFSFRNIIETSENLLEYDLPIISDTMYHTILGKEDHILIILK